MPPTLCVAWTIQCSYSLLFQPRQSNLGKQKQLWQHPDKLCPHTEQAIVAPQTYIQLRTCNNPKYHWRGGKFLASATQFIISRSSKHRKRRSCLIPKLPIFPPYWTEKYVSLPQIPPLFTTDTSSILKFKFFLLFAVFWSSLWVWFRLRFPLLLTFLHSSLLLFFIYLQARLERHCTTEILSLKCFCKATSSSKAFTQLDSVPLTIAVIRSYIASAHFQLTVCLSSCKTVKL